MSKSSVLTVSGGGMSWVNIWDVFHWGDCDATVEPQGYSLPDDDKNWAKKAKIW